MQRIPVEYGPDGFRPCISIRSRREQNPREQINARHVEQWLTDPPVLTGLASSLDTQGLASRLYRETLDRNPQYTPSDPVSSALTDRVTQSLALIQKMESRIRDLPAGRERDAAISDLKEQYTLYKTIVEAQKVQLIDSFTQNPYFDKYSTADDSRNHAREIRGVVYESIEDRGIAESQKLLRRSFDTRWAPREPTVNRVEAFELLRPSMTKMNVTYNL